MSNESHELIMYILPKKCSMGQEKLDLLFFCQFYGTVNVAKYSFPHPNLQWKSVATRDLPSDLPSAGTLGRYKPEGFASVFSPSLLENDSLDVVRDSQRIHSFFWLSTIMQWVWWCFINMFHCDCNYWVDSIWLAHVSTGWLKPKWQSDAPSMIHMIDASWLSIPIGSMSNLCTYICHRNSTIHVGTFTSPMDPTGYPTHVFFPTRCALRIVTPLIRAITAVNPFTMSFIGAL